MFAEQSIRDFYFKLSSNSPTPGGGTASCVVGSFGIALINMSIGVSSKKIEDENAEIYRRQLTEASYDLLRMADEDSEYFEKVMEAYRMPKTTEDEKAMRKSAIEEALKRATLAPLGLMKKINDVSQIFEYAYSILSQNVLSDFITGICLLQSAIYGGYANVLINLKSIKDVEFVTRISEEAKNIFEIQTEKLSLLKKSAISKLKLE